MGDFKSLADKSWGIGHVLFAMTESWQILLISFEVTGVNCFSVKLQEQDKIDNSKTCQHFVLKMMSAAYIQVHFRHDLIMEANTMNPNQTAPREQPDLGPYCLPQILPKNISR